MKGTTIQFSLNFCKIINKLIVLIAQCFVMPVHIGCSGWSYADPVEKGGWVKVFYPNAQIKKLQYYSQFFSTAEMDATFY